MMDSKNYTSDIMTTSYDVTLRFQIYQILSHLEVKFCQNNIQVSYLATFYNWKDVKSLQRNLFTN